MTHCKLPLIYITITIAFSLCLSGCESIFESLIFPKETEKKFRLNQQDPSRMIRKIDQDRASQNKEDIERQKKKDDSAKEKELNELIEKNLRRQP